MSAEFIDPQLAGLPRREGPLRFAVGKPDGVTSNSWRFWTEESGDAYLACRDNFKEVKVSFHSSGRWRMGFTSEAVASRPDMVWENGNRAWEVWDMPPETIPSIVHAFDLIFPTDELAVSPEMRTGRQWRNTVFIEAGLAGSGVLTAVGIFITDGDPELRSDSGNSMRLASLPLLDGRRTQLIAYVAPEANMSPWGISEYRRATQAMAANAGVIVPPEGVTVLFGRKDDGARTLTIVRAFVAEEIEG